MAVVRSKLQLLVDLPSVVVHIGIGVVAGGCLGILACMALKCRSASAKKKSNLDGMEDVLEEGRKSATIIRSSAEVELLVSPESLTNLSEVSSTDVITESSSAPSSSRDEDSDSAESLLEKS